MAANLGFGFLILAFIIALYAIVTALYGAKNHAELFVESARRATLVVFALISLATGMLLVLLLSGQFQYTYVFRVTSLDMPTYLKITALWGGQAGSLLFWVWLLSLFSAAVSFFDLKQKSQFAPWVMIVNMSTLAFFLFMVLFFENPFERIWLFADGSVISSFIQPLNSIAVLPPDGNGLNPLLRHIGMVVHPPLLYIGFVSFVIPFAYAIASLVTGDTEGDWLSSARRWSLVSWLALSAGLVVGSRWAYDVLGWGGYWGWDPVEIAALMPWLTCTAFLHSIVVQERRSAFKRWNYVLILITFCLVILGTFLTRSGVLSSVHAFSASSIGPVFFVLISLALLVSVGLLMWRWNHLGGQGEMRSVFSRESLFLFNNIVFICIFLICLAGVLFPLLTGVISGRQVTVGAQWYKATTGPFFALLLALMGVVPLSVWGVTNGRLFGKRIWQPLAVSLLVPVLLVIFGQRTVGGILTLWICALVLCVLAFDFGITCKARKRNTGEGSVEAAVNLLKKNSRRYGGYLVHLGVVLMAVGVVGIEFFQLTTQQTLNVGDEFSIGNYSLTLQSIQTSKESASLQSTSAALLVSEQGSPMAEVQPRIDGYPKAGQSVTVPGLYSTLAGDLYIVLTDWQPDSDPAVTFKVFYNPLINWFWLGAILLALGGLIAFQPGKKTAKVRQIE
ncbi:MAG: heme lyase CcmF/NrfE family subunit [Anaerolineaceae bacterium]|nr:heme lyase CcmF/NrfE family subunit [Anaerolineaceae bacterium]